MKKRAALQKKLKEQKLEFEKEMKQMNSAMKKKMKKKNTTTQLLGSNKSPDKSAEEFDRTTGITTKQMMK